MAYESILQKTSEYVRSKLEGEGSGHDWWHILRVRNMAMRLGQEEGADLVIVELGALLHDIADWKFHDGDDTAGPRVAREWLESIDAPPELIDHVCDIIATISFKGADVATPMKTIEGQVVQDADRLDAIGAMGIARAFAYGGSKGREMHNPEQKPVMHASFEEYKSSGGNTINHFYEKLLLLKDRMNTATGKQIAQDRHTFMEDYLKEFYDEWDGRK